MALGPGVALILWIALCLGTGWLGSRVAAPALVDWYPSLAKPSWTPPDHAFPIVWTTLFVLMGVAAWLVWRRCDGGAPALATGAQRRRLPLGLFVGQLALNALWSMLFFGLRSPGLALVEIVVLLIAIAATMIAFWRVSPPAGLLLLPYLLWAAYAAALNAAIWRLNA